MDQFDYVIVGAGTAGCLAANRLSADPDARVLLLEAGGRDNYHWIHIPIGYLYCIGNPRTDWRYTTQAEAGLNGRTLLYPRGRVLGGSSSINGMIYMRGQREDYDGWAQLAHDPSWRWDAVLPLFKRCEDHYRGASEFHGAGGEWRVEPQRLRWEILEAFMQACEQSGIPRTHDFNTGDNFGVDYFEVNQRKGLRWNASKAFLRPVAHRPNLTVVTGAHVERLVIEGRRCTGLTYRQNGATQTVQVAEEVVLAAGAVNTPQLLELSGIGAPDILARFGIAVAHALPGVGANLQDHLQLRSVMKVGNTRTLNTRARSLVGKFLIAAEYAWRRSGPMSMSPSQLGLFARSQPQVDRPDLQYHVQPLSLPKFGDPLHTYDAITASVCNLRPTSRGVIHLASPDPAAPPFIAPNYLATAEDRRVAAASLRLTRRIVAAPALARFAPEEVLPGPSLTTDEELARAAGDIGTTIFHPVGTCRMGPAADPGSVVDSRLRVHGVAGLRIVDASIMPTITSGNTNSPTLMIAEKGCDMMREDRRARRAAGSATQEASDREVAPTSV